MEFKIFEKFGLGIFTGLGLLTFIGLVLLIFLWPLIVVWALNYTFGTTIAYSFKSWLAILILTMTVRSTTTRDSK